LYICSTFIMLSAFVVGLDPLVRSYFLIEP